MIDSRLEIMVFGHMISVTQALSLINMHLPEREREKAPLKDCLGAICAADVSAQITMPPFDASAMDGYGVRFEDAQAAKTVLKLIGEAPAGSPFQGQVGPGEAVRIFTGSPMPRGADHVVIQENVNRDGDHITINTDSQSPRHIRKSGIDFKIGDILINKGHIITPAHIALAASGNHAALPIYKRPKIGILASGDELRPPGSQLAPGQIINSNMAALSALITHWGGVPVDLGEAKDDLENIAEHITAAKDVDIIVPIGGASVGDYDFMKEAFTAAGFDILFHKIAVKPGKPTWFGRRGAQRVLGLPGNPASAIVCAHLFLKALMNTWPSAKHVTVKLTGSISANGPRETYLRSELKLNSGGQLTVAAFPRQDSSLITPFVRANALIKLNPNVGPWEDGDNIEVIPLGVGPDVW